MLRDVPGSWMGLVRRKGKRCACIFVFVFMAVGMGSVAVAQGIDVSIESLHISWVESAEVQDRASLALDQALVGDTIRVSASVKNIGSLTAGQFNVDFFFTETISGEHGRIGSQAVIGLDSGETRRPVVTFDSSAFAPGIYVFSAEADPEQSLGETARCNNIAPWGDCADTLKQAEDRYQLTLLQDGSHISELSVTTDFSICQMGPLTSSLIMDVHNVGTQAFSFAGTDIEVWGYYRLSLDPPANEFIALSTDGSGNPQQLSKIVSLSNPGDEGFIRVTLDYSLVSRPFQPTSSAAESGDVLGKANPAQIRISVNPIGGGTPRDLYLPEQFALSQFYSEVDLWTFPARSHCMCDDYADIESVSVDPVIVGGLVFQAVSTSSGDRVHVLKVRTGEEKLDPWAAPSGASITALAASYDAEAGTYRVFASTSDGRIYTLNGADKETGSFLTAGWISAAGLVSGPAFLVISADGNLLIAGSEAGAYVLNALDGTSLRSDTAHDVTTMPAFGNSTGTVWFASDETIYGLRSNGTECAYDEVLDQISSPLALNGDESVLFFGTDLGSFFALDASSSTSGCNLLASENLLLKRTILGLDLVSDGADAVIYVTSSFGELARIEYDDGRGFQDKKEPTNASGPREIGASPAVLPNASGRDADVVFITGRTRDGRVDRPILQGWEKDLKDYQTVSVWSTSIPFLFKPKEDGVVPDALLAPIIDADTFTLLVSSSDGYLYAFDLGQFE